MKTIKYLDEFYKKAESCLSDIANELPQVASEKELKPIGKNMWLVNFSDISGKSWSVEDILKTSQGKSPALIKMCEKINWLFYNSPPNIVPFMKATAKRGYFLTGHDRDSRIKVDLNTNEIARLNLYITENS